MFGVGLELGLGFGLGIGLGVADDCCPAPQQNETLSYSQAGLPQARAGRQGAAPAPCPAAGRPGGGPGAGGGPGGRAGAHPRCGSVSAGVERSCSSPLSWLSLFFNLSFFNF